MLLETLDLTITSTHSAMLPIEIEPSYLNCESNFIKMKNKCILLAKIKMTKKAVHTRCERSNGSREGFLWKECPACT